MRRRDVITLLGGAAATASMSWPRVARAQQPAMPVVGFLGSKSPDGLERRLAGFRQGLAETGYVEGRNVAIEFHWADNRYDRLPTLVADLIQRKVAVIVIFGAVNGVFAAKAATTTLPIVFLIGSDPVQLGVVASLNRPGGNVTGVTLLIRELSAKRLEILREIVPGIAAIGLLVNPSNLNAEGETREVEDAAHSLGLRLHVVNADNISGIDAAFATLAQQHVGAFLTATDAFFTSRRDQLLELAARHAIPAMFSNRDFADAGGLMSYGANQTDTFHLVGGYAGRILKGDKPADLPVQQPTKFEMVLNLKTARVLGLQVPTSILLRADEVIE
jgi:putative tryptophan/tyrosine transport system substrate-binding protein